MTYEENVLTSLTNQDEGTTEEETSTPEAPAEGGMESAPEAPQEGGMEAAPEAPAEGGMEEATPEAPSEGGEMGESTPVEETPGM